MKFPFTNSEIVGALRPLDLPAHFSDAPVVVRYEHTLLEIDEFMDEPSELAEAHEISARDWAHLLSTDEAFEFQSPRPTIRYARCWIFRRWDAEQLTLLLRDIGRESSFIERNERDLTVVCVDENRGANVRQTWTRRLYDEAWLRAKCDRFDEALALAEVVWVLDAYRGLDSTLLSCAILEKLGRMADARDLLHMEANSTGRPLAELESILRTYGQKMDAAKPRTSKHQRYFSTGPCSPSFLVPNP